MNDKIIKGGLLTAMLLMSANTALHAVDVSVLGGINYHISEDSEGEEQTDIDTGDILVNLQGDVDTETSYFISADITDGGNTNIREAYIEKENVFGRTVKVGRAYAAFGRWNQKYAESRNTISGPFGGTKLRIDGIQTNLNLGPIATEVGFGERTGSTDGAENSVKDLTLRVETLFPGINAGVSAYLGGVTEDEDDQKFTSLGFDFDVTLAGLEITSEIIQTDFTASDTSQMQAYVATSLELLGQNLNLRVDHYGEVDGDDTSESRNVLVLGTSNELSENSKLLTEIQLEEDELSVFKVALVVGMGKFASIIN